MTDHTGFVEEAYLALNPDVRDAVQNGACSSGLEHYIRFGRAEGRRGVLPVDFDERLYLETHPHLEESIKRGDTPSAGYHFLMHNLGGDGAEVASEAKRKLVNMLWRGVDPFQSIPNGLYAVDKQGWNSTHPYLERAVRETLPQIVVEVGVWKGGSSITLASALRKHSPNGVLVSIDTWLGSSEHWISTPMFDDLSVRDGYPNLYYKFASNIMSEGLQGYVLPLPIDSINAFHVLKHFGIKVDIVHIDAGHDYVSVTNDLTAWWSLLSPGGVLVADDYLVGGDVWPEVLRGVDDFFASNRPASFEAVDGKAYAVKPDNKPEQQGRRG